MAQPADRVYVLANAVLDAVATYWPAGATALPTRQYVSNGLPAWDSCEQLAVQVERLFTVEGDLTQELLVSKQAAAGWAMRGVNMAVWIVRCVSDLEGDGISGFTVPSPEEYDADARVLLADPIGLQNAIIAGQKAGDIAGCDGLAFENWTAQGPEAGYAGGFLRLRVLLV